MKCEGLESIRFAGLFPPKDSSNSSGTHPLAALTPAGTIFDILKIRRNLGELCLKSIRIPVVQELMVASVKGGLLPSMFYGTPVLFGSPPHFGDVGQKTVEITAVHAVQLFHPV